MTFEASTVDLQGRHLIEASAGTGKTYSIANIFLRLLLEDHPSQQNAAPLKVDQILVVTFTNAATDELRGRIRRKVEEALQYFRGGASGDPFIIAYKQQKLGEEQARLLACERLYAALLLIDDAAIFTIHGFAARAIQTFLFETGALADVEVVIGQSHKQIQHFDDLLRHLSLGPQKKLGEYLSRQGIQGRKYVAELNSLIKRSGVEVLKNTRSMQELISHYESERDRLLQDRKNLANDWVFIDPKAGKKIYEPVRDEVVASLGGGIDGAAVTRAINFCNDKYSSIKGEFSAGKTQQAIYDSPNAKTLTGLAKQLYAMMANLFAFNDNENAINTAITESQSALLELLQQHPLQSDAAQLQPDEVIQLMNEKLDDEESAAILRRVITTQYPVCMVDEFQDTDPDQFRLFDRLYWFDRLHQGNESLGLFAIGDPKQSIYAFRGADVFAYLDVKAGMAAANIHTLDINFRSKQGVMDGVNALFRDVPDTAADTPVFVYPGIEYEHVFSCENPPQGQAQPRGIYRIGHAEPSSLVFVGHEAEESQTFNNLLPVYAADCAERILSLLQGEQRASVEKNDGAIALTQPGDIAVLVRDYKEAKAIKSALAKKNLTAVYLAQKDSVFKRCVFAKDLLFVLRAIDEPASRYHLKSAFATPLLRHFATDTVVLNELDKDDGYEKIIQQFSAYCKRWEEKGILPALYQVFEEQGLDAVFASRQDCDRLMTDFRHLGELLQQQYLLTGSRERLIDWYASQLSDDADTDEEAKSLRLESDDNLVKIVTLHGCKGLEYPVVFIPFFFGFKDVNLVKNPPFYHRQQSGHWQSVLDFQSDQETVITAMRRERMAEDMRLLYVGITRAIYQCYIGISRSYHNSKSNHLLPKSCWAHLLGLDEQEPSPDWEMLKARLQWRMQAVSLPVETCDFVTTLPASSRLVDGVTAASTTLELPTPVFPASCWQVTSYSALAYQKEMRVGTASKQDEAPVTALDEQTVSVLAADDANWQQDIRFRLRGGTTTGDCLHKLFERMADGETLAGMLDYELRAHGLLKPEWRIPENSTLEEETQRRSADITTWLQTVVATPLSTKIPTLEQLPSLQMLYASGQALPECGFDFSLGKNGSELTLSAINAVLSDICKTSAVIARKDQRQHLNGIMTGSIDLLFIHDKKVYVLDYKSNTLGKAPRFYDRKNMADAMQESRYDLQYLIYSVAAHRYMQQRLGDKYEFENGEYSFGGVFYLFLRGMGLPEYPDHGVWFHRPEKYAIAALDAALAGEEVIRG